MILWTSKPTTEDVPQFPGMGRRSWRWALEVGRWAVSFQREMRSERDGAGWHPVCEYFRAGIDRRFLFGSAHVYCDGPNCFFAFGWLHFSWGYWWCKKCMPDEGAG